VAWAKALEASKEVFVGGAAVAELSSPRDGPQESRKVLLISAAPEFILVL